jgi:hypothetical protein
VSLASVREIAAIHEVVDRWIVITSYADQARYSWDSGPYSFEASAKPGEEPPDSKPWLIRQGLLRHAEEALDALEAAGWFFTGCPHMEFSGRVSLAGDGGEGTRSFQHDIGLKLRFGVSRPRSAAERATDPEVVADALLAGVRFEVDRPR